MIWLVILYVPVIGVSVFVFVRAIFRHINAKEYFWNNLPDCEKDCINCLPRYPLFHYKDKMTILFTLERKDGVYEKEIL